MTLALPRERADADMEALSEPHPATTEALAGIVDRLVAAAAELRALTLAERVAAVDRAAEAWLAPSSPWRRRALESVPRHTGYPVRAVEVGLDNLWGALRAPALESVIAAEMPDGSGAGPRLALHTLAGNVPGAGVFGMVAALLAGVPSLVKPAAREPFLPLLAAQSLAAADPRLGAAVAIARWPGGSATHEAVALARADLVLAYGRAATLDALSARTSRLLLRFGPRISAALVAGASDEATAADAAWQIALFDQQGCLSPQFVIVVEDEAHAAARFADALARELDRLATALPRAPLSLAEESLGWSFLERQRWRAQEGAAVQVHADPAGRFSVVVDRTGAPPATPLNRHVVVVPVESTAAATAVLESGQGCLEAIGYAGPARGLPAAAAVAAAAGAHRLCPLERMQAPPFAWRQSGHARLASLVDAYAAAAAASACAATRARS